MRPRPTTPPPPAAAAVPDMRSAWLIVLLVAVLPLWVARDIPMVDLPQHLYVLDILARLHDPTTLYGNEFELRPQFTPYVGYYAVVAALRTIIPLELASRLFLSGFVAGLPLAMAFLLSSLRRPTWPALLVTPFAYGDSFAWGFINTCAAIPVALLALGTAIRAIERPLERVRWSVLCSIALLMGFALHPIPTGFLAFALPVALLTTRAPEDSANPGFPAWLRPRLPVLAAIAPLCLLAGIWAASLMRSGPASASLLSPGHLVWETPQRNLGAFLWLLGNIFEDGRDSIGLLVSIVVALVALFSRFFESVPRPIGAPSGVEKLRPYFFVAIAFGLFMTLPLSVGRVIQYLSPRFAALAATLCAGIVPRLGPRTSRWLPWAAAGSAIALSIGLASGFREYSAHADALRQAAQATSARPRIMSLVFDTHAPNVHHPVFLHAGAVLARLRGGIPSYSLAGWSQAPIVHRAAGTPSLPSEWRPDMFDYTAMGAAYDHFLVRGAPPDSLFAGRLGSELAVVGRFDDWWLIRRARATR